MTKRRQTTGGPKQIQKKPVPASSEPSGKIRKPVGEFHSRAEKEEQLQRRIILGTVITAAIIIAVLVAAIILDQVIVPNQVVATVGGRSITVADFQRRVKLERVLRIQRLSNAIQTYQQFGLDPSQLISQEPARTWLSDLRVPEQLGTTVINDMVQDELIRIAAAEQGVTVTQEDIDKAIQDYFQFDPTELAEASGTPTPTVEPSATPTPFVSPTPSPTPTVTPTPELTPTPSETPFPTVPPAPTLTVTEQFDQFSTSRDSFYDLMRRDAGLSQADVNTYFEVLALRTKMRDIVTADLTATGPYVDVRHILVATESEAQDVIAALQAGESFASLAAAVSQDTGSGASGGELGWGSVYNYVKPFRDAVMGAEIGATAGPVQSEFGYHVIQVRGRENRELTEDELNRAKDSLFDDWVTNLEETRADTSQIFPIWSSHVPTDPPSPFG